MGWIHSKDYPEARSTLMRAERYKSRIPLPKRLNYRIVEFVERPIKKLRSRKREAGR